MYSNNFGGQFASELVLWLVFGYLAIIIHLYIIRAIFNIPRFLRYQKAQIRLLEQLAKTQGVDDKEIKTIVHESTIWDTEPQMGTNSQN
jgi:hypothetical protein